MITFGQRIAAAPFVELRLCHPQVLLGCPEEHITANLVGCTHRQWHPHGFAVGPPPELASQLKGSLQPHPLVQWPQPPLELFDPDKPYPNFKALGTPGNQSLSVSRPAITFVISVTQAMGRPASVVQASAVAAARFHANCRFVSVKSSRFSASCSWALCDPLFQPSPARGERGSSRHSTP